MGIRSDIQSSLANAFDDELADAVVSAILRKNSQTYVAGTGVVNSITEHNTRLVASPVSDYLIDGEHVIASDKQCIILQNEIDVEPDIGDEIEFDSRKYNIMRVKADAAKVTWELLARET